MVSSTATTVTEYLESLSPDRRPMIETVRRVILEHLPAGYVEGVQFGMLGYCVPLARYPNTYNGQPLPIAALASQKGYCSLYLMGVYGNPEIARWFQAEYKKSGKKLDMGKSCVRFKSLDDLPLKLIGQVIARVSVEDYIAFCEASRQKRPPDRQAKKSATKRTAKRPAAHR